MDAVYNHLYSLFPEEYIIRLPIEDICTNARRYNSLSAFSFVGGTNVLNRDIRKYRQWNLTLHNIMILKRCVLMGCGWFQYENERPTRYTEWAYKKILDSNIIHSVRDNYTQNKLAEIGIKSINTGCPTLWDLDPNLSLINGKSKSQDCVVAITDYNKNPVRDKQLLKIVESYYRTIYVYPQGTGDIQYINDLGFGNVVKFLKPRLDEYNKCLMKGTDYIGTRLHAGIRALQLNQRSIIIGIDNRAAEMSRDFKLPVIHESEIEKIEGIISRPYDVQLDIPVDKINEWKSQFVN